MKKKPVKGLYTYKNGDFSEKVELLRLLNKSFEVQVSNYSGVIINPDGTKEKYMLAPQTPYAFIAYGKIKKDLQANLDNELLKYIIKGFDQKECRWYGNNKFINQSHDEVLNIDLNAAYLTALFNIKLISLDTYEYCLRLEKHDRLVCVGMLASRKEIFYYEAGELQDAGSAEKAEFNNVFYYLVKVIDDTMKKLLDLYGNNYLFYWFDGIYCLDEINSKEFKRAAEIITGDCFNYKTDVLKNFNVTRSDYLTININFDKKDKATNEMEKIEFVFKDKFLQDIINRQIVKKITRKLN